MYEITVNAKNHRKCKKSRLSFDERNRYRTITNITRFSNSYCKYYYRVEEGKSVSPVLTISGCTFSAYILFFYTFLVDTYSHKISFFVVYFFHDPSYSTFPFQVCSLFLSFARFSEVVAHILSSPHIFFIMNERIWFFVIVFSHS